MDEYDEDIIDLNIPDTIRSVQEILSRFVEINYETAIDVEASFRPTPEYIANIKGKILDIIRNNPPLATVPDYLGDGREDYLWYSDFIDDADKSVYGRYRTFIKPENKITKANYAEELAKIDLPYFKELVNLVSLERLCKSCEERLPEPEKEVKEVKPSIKIILPNIVKKTEVTEVKHRQLKKRSYQPKLTDEQYESIAYCMETIELFRRPVKVNGLKKLLNGKHIEPLQVANQKSLVYLFDQLSENKYIKETWISVADGNKDFISFRTDGNLQRYGDDIHYISMQQLLNNRNRNRREAIRGLDEIEDLIEQL